jgi:fatty-acyl-CoA synthase
MTVSSGATIPTNWSTKGGEAGPGFLIVFGQNEASPLITQTSSYDTEEDRALTIGRQLPQVEVNIIDTISGAIVPVGERANYARAATR